MYINFLIFFGKKGVKNMKSALGNYIHFHVANYMNYGVSYNQYSEKKPDLNQSIMAQKEKIKARINSLPEVNIGNLKDRVKKSFKNNKGDIELKLAEKKDEEKTAEDFLAMLQERIPISAALSGKGEIPLEMKNFGNYLNTNQTKNINIEEAKRLRDNIYRNVKTINEAGLVKKGSLTTLLNNLDTYFNYIGLTINKEYFDKIDLHNLDIINGFKAIIQRVSYSDAYRATVQGQVGEYVVAACGDVAQNLAKEALSEVIEKQKLIVGGDTTTFQIDPSMIPRTIGTLIRKKTKTNLYQVHSSQNKVDVQISINETPLNVSVKNYKPKGSTLRMHLQDVNLLTSLLTTESEFANHWLNIHSLGINSSDIDETFKEHLKYEALVSGNLLKKKVNLADTFVAINSETGDVFASNTKNILLGETDANFSFHPLPGTIRLSNKWKDSDGNLKSSALSRIAAIIANAHAIRISVVLSIKTDKMK
jgi:hypothetical protein